jgi:hypothetical protein
LYGFGSIAEIPGFRLLHPPFPIDNRAIAVTACHAAFSFTPLLERPDIRYRPTTTAPGSVKPVKLQWLTFPAA